MTQTYDTDTQTGQGQMPVARALVIGFVTASASMQEPLRAGDKTTKAAFARDVLRAITRERSPVGEEGSFACYFVSDMGAERIGGKSGGLNDDTFSTAWKKVPWRGSPVIMPVFTVIEEDYEREHGEKYTSERPKLHIIGLTDSPPTNKSAVAGWLSRCHDNVHLRVLLLGEGKQTEQAHRTWQEIAHYNDHMRIETVGTETNAGEVAMTLLDTGA